MAFSLSYAIASLLFSVLISVIIPRSSISLTIVIAGWCALFAIDWVVKPALNEVGSCLIASLNFFTAFRLGVKAASSFEARRINFSNYD